MGRPVQGRHAVDLGLVHVDSYWPAARDRPRVRLLRRVRQRDCRPSRRRADGGQQQPDDPRRRRRIVMTLIAMFRLGVRQIDSGSNSSSTLPWLSAKESRRTPTLSSRVRWRLASGSGLS